jgi:hypothetical protein
MILSGLVNSIFTDSELAKLDFWANSTLLGVAALFVYPVLQFVVAFCCERKWRIFALLPIVITGPIIIYTVLQIWRGADLWFIMATYVLPPATLYLFVVAAIHWFARRQTRAP